MTEKKEDVLSFQDELLIELVEHASKIRRYTGFVAAVLLVSLGGPTVAIGRSVGETDCA